MKSRAARIENLKATIRSRKGYLNMTDGQLADAIEISHSTYSRHKSNPMDMTLEEFRRIISVLKLPEDVVMEVLGMK